MRIAIKRLAGCLTRLSGGFVTHPYSRCERNLAFFVQSRRHLLVARGSLYRQRVATQLLR